MNNLSVPEIAALLRAEGFPPLLDDSESQFLLELLQLVAEGNPVSLDRVEQTARNLQLPLSDAAALVDTLAELDPDGLIVGFLGLSQQKHPHRFYVHGRSFSTWCAWDALFLPVLLKQTAKVESICPTTKATIFARVAQDQVLEIHPPKSVVTIALPRGEGQMTKSPVSLRKRFCCHVNLFVSTEAATEWIQASDQEMAILSVEKGHELGRTVFEPLSKFTKCSNGLKVEGPSKDRG